MSYGDPQHTVVIPSVGGHSVTAFFPDGMSDAVTATVIVYFHGHNHRKTLAEYLTVLDPRKVMAGKSSILIMPWGGNGSDFRFAESASGLDSMIQGAIDELTPNQCIAHTGDIVLSAHSGGGVALMNSVKSRALALSRLAEVWSFESMYSPSETNFWGTWLASNIGTRLRICTHDYPTWDKSGPAVPCQIGRQIELAASKRQLQNLRIERSRLGHNDLPNFGFAKFAT
jgi:hypothetical protein